MRMHVFLADHRGSFRIEQVAETYATFSLSFGEVGVFDQAIDGSVATSIEQSAGYEPEAHEEETSTRLGLGHERRNGPGKGRLFEIRLREATVDARGDPDASALAVHTRAGENLPGALVKRAETSSCESR